MNKKQRGAFYTTYKNNLLEGLTELVKDKDVVDLYCGDGDLLDWAEANGSNSTKGYDIVKTAIVSEPRNTLLDTPNITGKFILVNPPYLGRNKATDKTDFNKYQVNDRYKCAIKSLIEANAVEGIMIIPSNFWCDDDGSFREYVFNSWNIENVSIFTKPMFEDTSVRVTVFSFTQGITTHLNQELLDPKGKFKIGEEWFKCIAKPVHRITRLTEKNKANSTLLFHASDTGSDTKRIRLSITDTPYIGKISDRNLASIVLPTPLNQQQEKQVCRAFNRTLEMYREQYNSMFLTNFLASNKERKRMGFKDAYALLSTTITEVINDYK